MAIKVPPLRGSKRSAFGICKSSWTLQVYDPAYKPSTQIIQSTYTALFFLLHVNGQYRQIVSKAVVIELADGVDHGFGQS